jgi:DNA-binding MarR family transcriptional regulator
MTQSVQDAIDNLVAMGLVEVYTDDRTGEKMVRMTLDSGEVILEPLENIVSIES